MAKKSTRIALTYFVTIFVTLLIVGGVSVIMLKKYSDSLFPKNTASVVQKAEQEEYKPSAIDNQTVLFMLDNQYRSTGSAFVVTRFLPTDNKLLVMPLQSDLAVVSNGEEMTLYQYFRNNGAQATARELEHVLNVKIDKYIRFDRSTFQKFAAYFTTVTYEAPYSLIYEDSDTGEVTVIREGTTTLDNATMYKLFTFPEFKNGESTRTSVIASVCVDFINASHTRLISGMDQIVDAVLSSGIETDMTAADYEMRKEAMKYVVDRTTTPAEILLPSGVYDSNGCYALDDSFISTLRSRFGADLYSTIDRAEENGAE